MKNNEVSSVSVSIEAKVEEELAYLKRGIAEIISEDELREKLYQSKQEKRPLNIKLGIDPTAPDVHLGFAVVLRKLRHFQELGHQIIIIIGDFTARIGDPSGRREMRNVLSPEEIEANAVTYQQQFSMILDPQKTKIVFNSQWLASLTLEDLIKLASVYTIAQILEREDFYIRYQEGKPIGLQEFLYPLMQGYDSIFLNADVELGGTDQKFNLLVGRELQRQWGQKPQVAIMMPILEGIDGIQKMSKSLGNYIGIREHPQEMFGKVMSIPDHLMSKYFYLATEMETTEIKSLEEGLNQGKIHPRDLKSRLAYEIVSLYHGADKARKAQAEFDRIFKFREFPQEMPEFTLARNELKDGKIWTVKLLFISGLAESQREARRLIAQGAVSIDGEKVSHPDLDLVPREGMVLQVGKRSFVKIRLKD